MTQWTILVLGVLRLGLDADYDRIHELANQHRLILHHHVMEKATDDRVAVPVAE